MFVKDFVKWMPILWWNRLSTFHRFRLRISDRTINKQKCQKKSMYILVIVVPFSKSTVVAVLGLTGFELWETIAAMHSKLTSNSRRYVGWEGTSRDALSSHFPGCSQAIHQTHCPQVCNPNSQLPSPWPRWKRLPGNHAARKQLVCRHFYFLHFSPEESSAIQE